MPGEGPAAPGAHRAYIGLGSNLGQRREQLRRALRELKRRGVDVRNVSSLYETEPVGFADQPRFFNAVAEVETRLEPLALLRLLKDVEKTLGRRPTFRNGPREIDLDLLTYDDVAMQEQELTLPHPRMAERAFVMVPLSEVEGHPAMLPKDMVRVEDAGWARDPG